MSIDLYLRIRSSLQHVKTILSLGILVHAFSFAASAQEATTNQAISVIVAQTGEAVRRVRAIGTVVPKNAVFLRADLDGLRVTSVDAEAGDLVQAGDVLARLDDTMLRAEELELQVRLLRAEGAIQQARNELEDAEIAFAQAEADKRRSVALQRRGITSSQAAETLDTASRRAGAARDIAAQALKLATIDRRVIEAEAAHLAARLERTLVRAPVAGRVQERVATVGMLVTGSGQPLFTLAQDAVLEVDAGLEERDFALTEVGQAVELWVAGRPQPLRGVVRLVLPQLASETRLGRIRISVPSPSPITAGGFVRAEVEVSRHDGVVVPASAVSVDGAQSSVWTERDGVVERVRVEAGVRSGSTIHIASGIEEGARLVLKAGSLLMEGDRIDGIEVAYDVPLRSSPALQSMRVER